MEIPSIITSILIAGLAIYLVVNPLFQNKDKEKIIKNKPTKEQEMKHLYVTLNEIEMDYHMGKLTEEEFLELRTKYENLIAIELHQRHQQQEQQEQEFQQLVEKKKQISQEIQELNASTSGINEDTSQKIQALKEELGTINQSLQKFIQTG